MSARIFTCACNCDLLGRFRETLALRTPPLKNIAMVHTGDLVLPFFWAFTSLYIGGIGLGGAIWRQENTLNGNLLACFFASTILTFEPQNQCRSLLRRGHAQAFMELFILREFYVPC